MNMNALKTVKHQHALLLSLPMLKEKDLNWASRTRSSLGTETIELHYLGHRACGWEATAADLLLAGYERLASVRNQVCGEMHRQLPLDGAARNFSPGLRVSRLRQETGPSINVRYFACRCSEGKETLKKEVAPEPKRANPPGTYK